MTKPTRSRLPERPQDAADQIRFVLADEQWQAFVELLERPEQPLTGLTEFLARPSILDEPDDATDHVSSTASELPGDEPQVSGG